MHKLQIIYTHENGQLLGNFPLDEIVLSSKKKLISFAFFTFLGKYTLEKIIGISLPEDLPNVPKLIKLSFCVILDSNLPEPKQPNWFKKCQGKIWWDELEQYKNPLSLKNGNDHTKGKFP